jgi:Dolichyl-phosphate-mannose-protein mannosyltransferase
MPSGPAQKSHRGSSLVRSMENAPARWLLIFSLVYLVAETCASARLPFWLDEIITSYLAELPSATGIWPLIAQGIELNPPLPFWIAWAVRHTIGPGEIAARLQAILGFWLMCICLYHFVRRRTDRLHGFLAFLFPLFTYTSWSADKARGYGLLLGFSGLALLCWQLAADGIKRPVTLIGIAIAIAGALSCHYYALYVAAAIAVGETIRTLDRKRIDAGIWFAFAVGVTPLAFYLPLIRTASKGLRTFWIPPAAEYLYSSYADLLGPITVVLFFFLAVVVWNSGLDREQWQPATLQRHELFTILSLVAMPLVLYLCTFVAPVGFYTRYVQPVVIGATVLVATFIYRIGGSNDGFRDLWVTLLVGFCFLPWAIWQTAKVWLMPPPGTTVLHSLNIPRDPSLPVVVDSDNEFVMAYYYAPPDLRTRLYMLADIPSAVKYLGADTSLRSLQLAQTFRDVHVVDYHEFVRANREFLLARTLGASWITQKLLADGAELRLVEFKKELGTLANDDLLYHVEISRRTTGNPRTGPSESKSGANAAGRW